MGGKKKWEKAHKSDPHLQVVWSEKIIDRSLPSLLNRIINFFWYTRDSYGWKSEGLTWKAEKQVNCLTKKDYLIVFYAVFLSKLFLKPSASFVTLYATWEQSNLSSL